MNISGLNTLNLAPTPTTSSRTDAPAQSADPKGLRGAAPMGPSFGDVLNQRGAKAAGKEVGPKGRVTDARERTDGTSSISENAAPDDAPRTEAPRTPVVAQINVVNKKTSAPTNEADDQVEATDGHEAALSEFLNKMNDELGVSPADVMAAFEKLSDEDLTRAPEDTTEQMVAAMGLTGQPAALAKQYLAQLIEKTAPAEGTAHESASAIADVTADASSGTRALDRMDAHLIMNSPAARAPSVPGAGAATLDSPKAEAKSLADLTPSSEDAAPAADTSIPASANPTPNPLAAPVTPPLAATPPLTSPFADSPKRADAATLDRMVEQMEPASSDDSGPRIDQLVRNLMNKAPAASAVAGTVAPKFAADANESNEVATSAKPNPFANSFASARRDGDETADSDTNSDEFTSDLTSGRENQFARADGPKSEFARELKANATNAPAGTAAALAPEIVDNARVSLKDGGGEMNVTMNPDGLGEISMKVNVKDGKVSVQMATENDDTKKLLEHQLNDLKSQLVLNNLQVDKIQVDTGSNLAQQNDQNQQDAQRQAARQSFEQFAQGQSQQNQQNQARRQAYDASPANRGYGNVAGAGRPAAAMPPVSRPDNSRRLNLVA